MYKFEKCIPPLLAARDHQAIVGKIQRAMREKGFDYLVLNHVQDTFYVTGYMPLMASAASVLPAEGNAILIVSTLESEAAPPRLRWMRLKSGRFAPGCLLTTVPRNPAMKRAR